MSIIVSVKINDGIVLASDSAVTFANGQIYQHENKIVKPDKGIACRSYDLRSQRPW